MTSQKQLKLVLVGCAGRMGTAIAEQAAVDVHCEIVGRIDRELQELPASANNLVVVDFSSENGTKCAITTAYDHRCPLLVGTTGLSGATIEALHALSNDVPVAVVSNTAVGVAALRQVVELVCRFLGTQPSWRVELDETHHVDKKDAPSGTAVDLARVCTASGIPLSEDEISSIREGSVFGEHELRFSSEHETLTLRHVAHDRVLFAQGTIAYARALQGQSPGFYEASDLFHPMSG